MTMYEPLEEWLRGIAAPSVSLSLAEVGSIIGAKLPPSSYKYEAHWRGTTPGRPGGAIAAAGWHVVKIDWPNATIHLRRAPGETSKQVSPAGDPPTRMTKLVPVELASHTWQALEIRAASYFSDLWQTDLAARPVDVRGVSKKFDLVSSDGQFVGDAKNYRNIRVPAAKWSAIAEYVWLLQNVDAERRFIVFGGDAEVARRFLTRWRPLIQPVEFYLLTQNGHVLL